MLFVFESVGEFWDFHNSPGLGAALRLKGLNYPALDVLIAIVASSGKIPLLTRDAHFSSIRDEVLPDLQLC